MSDSSSNTSRTIALFDCDYHKFDEHLEFYTALGFDIVYYQKAPYRYASVKMGGLTEIGFYGARNDREGINRGGCYVDVPDVREVYEQLRANLKAYYGRIPVKGTPRISRLNKTAEDWRVNITDLNENTIIIGESLGDSTTLMQREEARVKALQSKFEKLYASAYRFAYSKEDYFAARNTLEVAFNKYVNDGSDEYVVKARVLQAEVFDALNQRDRAIEAITLAKEIVVSELEQAALRTTYERLRELEQEDI
ncbi:hypothetical protein [Geomicrobium sp. JCM 19038]|uniref:hypothetical protein n=1 Tax=Geomicrobium sp. JCM 19038 TaxID=1460635 RepID=UPI00045F3080|nr:hypothetical protein [Geomicrobium sp. JCM 19038]GAK08804.1 histone acetyltransferase HPA2 [Geomicrobium sp. JCM 19038]